MENALFLSMVSIVVVAVVGTFLHRRSRDKCLKTFSGDTVTLEQPGGKGIWGRLRVEITGLELLYAQSHQDAAGHIETSYILYKQEYAKIQAIARYVDELDEKGMKKRARELRAADHPSALRRLRRRFTNLFNTFRDSVMEAVNLFIGRAKKGPGIGTVLSSQDKYVSNSAPTSSTPSAPPTNPFSNAISENTSSSK